MCRSRVMHENELVDRLVESCDTLTGYSRDAHWQDSPGRRTRPDRVLRHPSKPPIGVELAEALPQLPEHTWTRQTSRDNEQEGPSAMLATALWDQQYELNRKLRLNYPELRDITVDFGYLRAVHRRKDSVTLAHEIVKMMRWSASNMEPHGLLELRSEELAGYPVLASTVDAVRIIRSSAPRWWSPRFRDIEDWLKDALLAQLADKAENVEAYTQNIKEAFQLTESPQVHLLIWARNEDPPVLPVIQLSDSLVRLLEVECAYSGFDAVWYLNGVRDAESGVLHEPQRIYPVPPQETFFDIQLR